MGLIDHDIRIPEEGETEGLPWLTWWRELEPHGVHPEAIGVCVYRPSVLEPDTGQELRAETPMPPDPPDPSPEPSPEPVPAPDPPLPPDQPTEL